MIKASELRIGNIFHYWPIGCGLVPDKVIGLRIKSKTPAQRLIKGERSGWNQETQCHPIKLIPEILEKAGFTEMSAENSRHFEKDVLFVEVIDLFGTTIMARLNHRYLPNLLLCKVDYLHQLQNLYFSLTGEELIINL